MKTTLRSVLAAAFLGVTTLVFAQPAPKVYVLDMAKVFDGHWKTEDQQSKLKVDQDKAVAELERLDKEIRGMSEKFKEQKDQMDNPALTAEARDRAKGDAQKTLDDINAKRQEGQQFQMNAQRTFQQRIQNFRGMLIDEISKLAADIVKKKGGTVLFDKGSLIYSDPAYDITDEVIAEIGKTRPANMPAAAPATGSTAPATGGKTDTPSVSFPGSKK